MVDQNPTRSSRRDEVAVPTVTFVPVSHVKSNRLNYVSITVWNPKVTVRQQRAVMLADNSMAWFLAIVTAVLLPLVGVAAAVSDGSAQVVFGVQTAVFGAGVGYFGTAAVKAWLGKRAARAALRKVAPGEDVYRTLIIPGEHIGALELAQRAQAYMSRPQVAKAVRDLLWAACPGHLSASSIRELEQLLGLRAAA